MASTEDGGSAGRSEQLQRSLVEVEQSIRSDEATLAPIIEKVRGYEAVIEERRRAGVPKEQLAAADAALADIKQQLEQMTEAANWRRARFAELAPHVSAAVEAGQALTLVQDKVERLQALMKNETRIAHRSRYLFCAQLGLLCAVLVVVIWIVDSKIGFGIKSEFYIAAAGVIPLLLVAGFVELSATARGGASWAAVALGLPATVGEVAILFALASGTSRFWTLACTCYGLAATLGALLILVPVHGEAAKAERIRQHASEIAFGGWQEAQKRDLAEVRKKADAIGTVIPAKPPWSAREEDGGQG